MSRPKSTLTKAQRRAILSKKMAQWRAERKALGLCVRCDAKARPGGLLCLEHRRLATSSERDPATPTRPCVLCGTPTGLKYCKEHTRAEAAESERALQEKRRAERQAEKDARQRKRTEEIELRNKKKAARAAKLFEKDLAQKREQAARAAQRILGISLPPTPPPESPALDLPIELPSTKYAASRLERLLLGLEVTTYRKLYHYRETDFLRFPNFGRRSLKVLRDALQRSGLPPLEM